MNCKFCTNFIPDGSDSCPVCGRRQTEDTITKLLSENQPSTFAPVPAVTEKANADTGKKRKKKGLFAPLLAIAASAGSWLYAWSQGIWEKIRLIFNGSYGEASTTGADSAFEVGGSTTNAFGQLGGNGLLILGIAILVTIIGIVGIISLFRRLGNRLSDND